MADLSSKLEFLKISKCKKAENLEKEMRVALSKAIKANQIKGVCSIAIDKIKVSLASSKKPSNYTIRYCDAKSLLESESLQTLVVSVQSSAKNTNIFIVSIRFENKTEFVEVLNSFLRAISEKTGGQISNVEYGQVNEDSSNLNASRFDKNVHYSSSSSSNSSTDDISSQKQSPETEMKHTSEIMSKSGWRREDHSAAKISSNSHKVKAISMTEFDPFPNIVYINEEIMKLFDPSKNEWYSQVSHDGDVGEFAELNHVPGKGFVEKNNRSKRNSRSHVEDVENISA